MEKYKIISELGRSNLTESYQIKDKKSGALRCLKKLNLSQVKVPLDTLFQQFSCIQQLNHPNVMKMFEHFIDEKWFCYVTEFADEGDLNLYLANQKSLLSELKVLKIGGQIAAGLSYIHSQSIAHRKLKPENIFLFSNGVVKVGDIGIVDPHFFSELQPLLKSHHYYPPEFFNQNSFSFEADCWALGCILYELISLRKAFSSIGNSPRKSLRQICFQRPCPLTGLYSPEILVLVDDLLSQDTMQRISALCCVESPIFTQSFISLGLSFLDENSKEYNTKLAVFFFQLAYNSVNPSSSGWEHNAKSEKIYALRKLYTQPYQENIEPICKYAVTQFTGYDSSSLRSDEVCKLLNKGTEEKDPFLTFVYGLTFKHGYGNSLQNNSIAMSLFKKSAEIGDANGMAFYGYSLKNGFDGKEPRVKDAMVWYKKSAEAGSSIGMNNYGLSLSKGDDGNPPKKKEAMMWYQKSAYARNPIGMYDYGISLENGYDGDPKLIDAMFWFKKSAEAGNSLAMYDYGKALEKGYHGFPQKEQAAVWYKKCAETGDRDGMIKYAQVLELGMNGLEPNFREAQIWRQKAGK